MKGYSNMKKVTQDEETNKQDIRFRRNLEVEPLGGAIAPNSANDSTETPPEADKSEFISKLEQSVNRPVSLDEVFFKPSGNLHDEFDLSFEQALELAEWIISSPSGLPSADKFDDRRKQAFLILLSVFTYTEELGKREDFLNFITERVYSYTVASSFSCSRFIEKGYLEFIKGNWQPGQGED
jgi:hypothetical protein